MTAVDDLVRRVGSDDIAPVELRAALSELLRLSPAVGAALALDRLAREPRIKPSRRLLIDPHDTARRGWEQRVAAAAALAASPAVSDVFDELRDEFAENGDLARDVLGAATAAAIATTAATAEVSAGSGRAIHAGLALDRRAALLRTCRLPE